MNNQSTNNKQHSDSSIKLPSGISSPANNSLQQSYYLSALERYLGMRGFVSPVKCQRKGHDLSYDFFHLESKTAIKIFTTLDEYNAGFYYAVQPIDTVYIVDPTSHCVEQCDPVSIANVPQEFLNMAQLLRAYVYLDGDFWVHDGEQGGNQWKRVIPYELERRDTLVTQ